MEEIVNKCHEISLFNREKGNMTGVVDVMLFNSQQILLETVQGMLTIKGQELHVSRLQLEQGEVDIEGKVDCLIYTQGGISGRKQKGNVLKRMFR